MAEQKPKGSPKVDQIRALRIAQAEAREKAQAEEKRAARSKSRK